MSEENVTPPFTIHCNFDLEKSYKYGKEKVKFKRICLKQDSVSVIHQKVANLYIHYKLIKWSRDLNTYFTLIYYLFEAVKLTENGDSDKYMHSYDSI